MGRKKKDTVEETGEDLYFKEFPRKLRSLFEEAEASGKKITQSELAAYLGTSRSNIGHYCSGAVRPDWETIVKISKFFNVSCDYLLTETTTKSPDIGIKAMCEKTRLSENTLKKLYMSTVFFEMNKLPDFINAVCEGSIIQLNSYIFDFLTLTHRLSDVSKSLSKKDIDGVPAQWLGDVEGPDSWLGYTLSENGLSTTIRSSKAIDLYAQEIGNIISEKLKAWADEQVGPWLRHAEILEEYERMDEEDPGIYFSSEEEYIKWSEDTFSDIDDALSKVDKKEDTDGKSQ